MVLGAVRTSKRPTIDTDVMSVNLGDDGDDPMVFYRDPMQLMTHLAETHGGEAVMGMAGLQSWSQGPAKALHAAQYGMFSPVGQIAITAPRRCWAPAPATCDIALVADVAGAALAAVLVVAVEHWGRSGCVEDLGHIADAAMDVLRSGFAQLT
jgi:hypothetical protein